MWDLTGPDYAAMVGHGTGLTATPSKPGEFAIEQRGDLLLNGIYPGGAYTHLLSTKHPGVIQTPSFEIDSDYISFRVMGGDLSFVQSHHRELRGAARRHLPPAPQPEERRDGLGAVGHRVLEGLHRLHRVRDPGRRHAVPARPRGQPACGTGRRGAATDGRSSAPAASCSTTRSGRRGRRWFPSSRCWAGPRPAGRPTRPQPPRRNRQHDSASGTAPDPGVVPRAAERRSGVARGARRVDRPPAGRSGCGLARRSAHRAAGGVPRRARAGGSAAALAGGAGRAAGAGGRVPAAGAGRAGGAPRAGRHRRGGAGSAPAGAGQPQEPRRRGAARVPDRGRQPAVSRAGARPAAPGRGGHRPRQPAHGARRRQPGVALPVRLRHRAHRRQLRPARRSAVASRAARLPGGRLRRTTATRSSGSSAASSSAGPTG